MFFKISLIILILCYLRRANGLKLFENDDKNDQSLISKKFQIKPRIILPDHHQLIRRSKNQNQKKSHRILKNSLTSANSSKPSESTPAPVTDAFQNSERHSILMILIQQKLDFTKPLSDQPFGKKVCLLDYAVTEIIDKDKKLAPGGRFIYFELHKNSGLLKEKLEEQLTELEFNFIIDQCGSWKDKTILMPLYRENDYAAVLLGNTKLMDFVYYDPKDPKIINVKTKKDLEETLHRFFILITKRNTKVSDDEKISTENRWMIRRLANVPRIPNKDQGDTDFGIHALQLIDLVLNDKLSFRSKPSSRFYKDKVLKQLKARFDYGKWHKKQDEELNAVLFKN